MRHSHSHFSFHRILVKPWQTEKMQLPMLTLLLILSMNTPSQNQVLQINDITNNAGALILQEGEGRIIDGYDRLLHVIDFVKLETSVLFIENMIGQLQNSPSDFSDIIKMKLNEIRFLFNMLQVKPNRNKRAINMLGSTIKFITGNLDADDLALINSNLDELRKSGNTIIKQNNRQIKINTKFENRINIMTDQIKNQQNALNSILKDNDYIISENQKIQIVFQLNTFIETLKSIEYAILLTKLNIISKLILTPKEIDLIAQEISSQGLEIHSLDDTNNYLTTSTLYSESTLIISVNIPRLLPITYRKVSIEPLPILNHTAKLMHNEVLMNSNQILAIVSKCQQNRKVTLCERRQVIDISENPCEAALLRGRFGHCNLVEKPPTTEVREIAPGTLLILTVHQDVNINSTCGINNKALRGIHLITFHNCSIYINNELYENLEFQFYQPIITPLEPTKIKPMQIHRHINLSELHAIHIENRKHLETIDIKNIIGFVSISTLTVFILAVTIFGIIKYQQFAKTGNCSGRAILAQGAVNDETKSQSLTGTGPGIRGVSRQQEITPTSNGEATSRCPNARCTLCAKSGI